MPRPTIENSPALFSAGRTSLANARPVETLDSSLQVQTLSADERELKIARHVSM
jgi:hypothetical protein